VHMPETLQQVRVGFRCVYERKNGVLRCFWVRKAVFLRAGSCVLASEQAGSFNGIRHAHSCNAPCLTVYLPET
jgi:hypothetical protein